MSFELVVRQAPEGAIGVAPKPALQADELLICDVHRRPGQTQIFATDIDISRRQAFIFAQGSSVSVVTGAWSILQPLAATVQAALDEIDAELRDHFTEDNSSATAPRTRRVPSRSRRSRRPRRPHIPSPSLPCAAMGSSPYGVSMTTSLVDTHSMSSTTTRRASVSM
ncbi:MAG: hypothetical protein FWD73_08185 [Polyangiaceae bacterium]|nr:hypothetical protein [Polyangiaceae bacterium]